MNPINAFSDTALCTFQSKLAPKKQPSQFAMDHFDAFYSKVFGLDAWRSMRIALLSKKKYCAVVNPFAVTEELIERLRSIGCREIVGYVSLICS